MRILQVHNRYVFEGGEENVVRAEGDLLVRHGHAVELLELQNRELVDASSWRRAKAGIEVTWNGSIYRDVRARLKALHADVVHCHNIFPRVSPAVYYAAQAEGVPVVHTLHNYRLMCLNGMLLREGRPCQKCVGRMPLSGIIHRCYRGSMPGSVAMATALAVHRFASTWVRRVAAYIALSEHSKRQFVAGGLPQRKLVVRPNFVHPDPGPGSHDGRFVLYAGRLSEEKGVRVLLSAWETLGQEIPLRLCGAGPLERDVETASKRFPGVTYLGFLPVDRLTSLMQEARVLVIPSLWDEHSPTTLLQAFAAGLPSVVSDIGALREMIHSGPSGWAVPPGDATSLRRAVRNAWTDQGEWDRMSRGARDEFLSRHTASKGYETLVAVYERALGRRPVGGPSTLEPALVVAPTEDCPVTQR